MLDSLRRKLKDYGERNERAHALARFPTDDNLDQYSAVPLLSEAGEGLDPFAGTGLWVLEIFNEDVTPIEYVIYVIRRFSKRDKVQATELALKIHGTGCGQLVVGTRATLEAVTRLIEQDANARQFPIRCAARAV